MSTPKTPRDHSLFIKAFRSYLQYVNSWLYFKKEHVVGLENVPVNGTPLVVVANHQNCLNDPLCVCLKLTDRRMNFIARANVFNNPLFNKALRAMGLLPAYRMSHEGYSSVKKNRDTFSAAENALMDGETVMLYPEASHQDKHWLGTFKIGYLRIAFEAAEKMEFKQDVMILPSCNHYSNYFHARTEVVLKFGTPISLMPYYERYQEAPRETMMEINQLVRSKIQELMLHIEDLDHYEAIDFLRITSFGRRYAQDNGFKFNYLPSRLLSDQKLVNDLQTATEKYPEEMEQVYQDTNTFAAEIKRLKVRDWIFEKDPNGSAILLRGLGLLALLPLFIVSIIPTALLFIIPELLMKKMVKDHMFVSSFNIGISAFISVPLCLILPVVLLWVFLGFWPAFAYFVAFPAMFILSWNYIRIFLKFMGTCKYLAPRNRKKINELKALRKSIYDRLDEILKRA